MKLYCDKGWLSSIDEKYDKTARTVGYHSGSPFQCVVVPGAASVDVICGWMEQGVSDKHGKALEQNKDQIIAGDASLRPVIYDGLSNNTTSFDDNALRIHIVLPDGTIYDTKNNPHDLRFTTQSKGGVTTYDVRHEATNAGLHEVHMLLNGTPIRGSPVTFDVDAAAPEVKTAKVTPPPETRMASRSIRTTRIHSY